MTIGKKKKTFITHLSIDSSGPGDQHNAIKLFHSVPTLKKCYGRLNVLFIYFSPVCWLKVLNFLSFFFFYRTFLFLFSLGLRQRNIGTMTLYTVRLSV